MPAAVRAFYVIAIAVVVVLDGSPAEVASLVLPLALTRR